MVTGCWSEKDVELSANCLNAHYYKGICQEEFINTTTNLGDFETWAVHTWSWTLNHCVRGLKITFIGNLYIHTKENELVYTNYNLHWFFLFYVSHYVSIIYIVYIYIYRPSSGDINTQTLELNCVPCSALKK